MTDDNNTFTDMIVCPHCSKPIQFQVECIDDRQAEITKIKKTTTTEFNIENDGK